MTGPLPQQPAERELAEVLAKYQADQDEWQRRAAEAHAKAAAAYARLLHIAEEVESNQARKVALFLAATCDGRNFPFDLFELRTLDVDISDDMIVCIDALRWGTEDLGDLVPDGFTRVDAAIQKWELERRSE